MSTTMSGELHSFDTKDSSEISRVPGAYTYTVSASGGGTLRFKIEYFSGDEIAPPGDAVHGQWLTLEDRQKIDSGNSLNGSFTLPKSANASETETQLRLIFSRGLGTVGVDYQFAMQLA
jgi:hypothetical protein